MMIAAANIAIVTAKPTRKSRYTTSVIGVDGELLLMVSPGWFMVPTPFALFGLFQSWQLADCEPKSDVCATAYRIGIVVEKRSRRFIIRAARPRAVICRSARAARRPTTAASPDG